MSVQYLQQYYDELLYTKLKRENEANHTWPLAERQKYLERIRKVYKFKAKGADDFEIEGLSEPQAILRARFNQRIAVEAGQILNILRSRNRR